MKYLMFFTDNPSTTEGNKTYENERRTRYRT